jgi:hypothetical protein
MSITPKAKPILLENEKTASPVAKIFAFRDGVGEN